MSCFWSCVCIVLLMAPKVEPLALPGAGTRQALNQVVFVRHGESTWNREGIYIGWTDVPLTAAGELEARAAGQVLLRAGYQFDRVFTSLLKRSLKTTHLVMQELDQLWVQETKDWRLNERFFGGLIGKTKPEAEHAFGKDKVALWGASYDTPPAPMSTESSLYPGDDPRYQGLAEIPTSECMRDVQARVVQLWEEEITPAVRSGQQVLVSGHANNLKALLKHLDGIPDETAVGLSIPRATPIAYDLDVQGAGGQMRVVPSPRAASPLSGEFVAAPAELEAMVEVAVAESGAVAAGGRGGIGDGEVNAF